MIGVVNWSGEIYMMHLSRRMNSKKGAGGDASVPTPHPLHPRPYADSPHAGSPYAGREQEPPIRREEIAEKPGTAQPYAGREQEPLPGQGKLLQFVLIGTALELLYLVVFALAPLSTINGHASPLATAWPWTLAPSQFLFHVAWSASGEYTGGGIYYLLLGLVLIALSAIYLYAVVRAFRRRDKIHITSRWLLLLLVGAAVFGATLLFLPALFSNDVFSYIFTGRMLTIYHADPMNTAPAQFQRDPYLPWITQPGVPNIYGPLWLAITSLLVGVGNSPITTLLLFKGLALLSHLVNCLLIWAILGKIAPARRLPGTLLYAWNPLALVELAGNGHNDGLLICLLLLATWLLVQQRGGWYDAGAFAFTGLAISLNFVGLIFAPLFTWFSVRNERDNVRVVWGCCWRALVTLITLLIVYLPFWHGGSTFVAISASIDMQHFVHSLLAMVAVPLDWLYSQAAQGANFPANYMQPSSAANTMLVASGLFIFALIYLYLLGKMRRAPVTIADGHSTGGDASIPALPRTSPAPTRDGGPYVANEHLRGDASIPALPDTTPALTRDEGPYVTNEPLRGDASIPALPRSSPASTRDMSGVEVLFTCMSAAILGYVVFVAGVFWPWYILWALWIVALRHFDALSVSVLLLSCTALLTYSLLYLDRWPIALYQPLLIFGIPFVYLIVKRSNERNGLEYERRGKTA